jgi:5,10-methylene-tetrahydrofolate dehydrogenase/methenyl tetrahydrofolate cyclohydrolase
MAEELRAQVELDVQELAAQGIRPGLATVLVGDDYAASAYERRVRRLAEALGCYYASESLDADAEEADALATVGMLNADPRISGILILRPLPAQIREGDVFQKLDPAKDIEAVHPLNAGLLALGQPRFVPSTPASVFHMLDRHVEQIGSDPRTFYNGLDIVLVGRSNNVGKPALWLGLAPERHSCLVSSLHGAGRSSRRPHAHRGHPRRRGRRAGARRRQHGEGRRDRDRRRDQPGAGPGDREDTARRRSRLRERDRTGSGDLAGARRCGPDHRRLAAPKRRRGGTPRRARRLTGPMFERGPGPGRDWTNGGCTC